MTRLPQKKNISVSTVFRIVQKMGGKSQTFQETPAEFSSGSERSGEGHLFVD